MSLGSLSQAESPDVVTSSDQYSRRFSGAVGEYFLARQSRLIREMLSEACPSPTRVLEVGGGHAQVVPVLLELGHEVWVQGSDQLCMARVRRVVESLPEESRSRVHLVESPLDKLPFDDRTFDIVVSIRTLAHVDDWTGFVSELSRVSRRAVLIDYPPVVSWNVFYPLFFRVKRWFEGDTRPFHRFRRSQLSREFSSRGLDKGKERRQFFLPMGLHRKLGMLTLSIKAELIFEAVGLTSILGSPALFLAERVLSA
ncbi:MAG: class I SAM-dependent methyltransferase [Bdellovibrionales bacterium]|nr:class I SAM-dependent methyltransferase [Bdellovibrionales bacterium]